MEKKQEEDYSGIWMQLGCFLSAIAILAILGIIVYMFLMLLSAKGLIAL